MTKTGQQIENDIYGLVKSSPLASLINGEVYKFGLRPKDSTNEDAIVKFVQGYDNQIQSGTVVVNVYVPDFDPYENGVLVRDITRCEEIEIAANEWVQTLTTEKSDYKFKLAQTIYTQEEPEISQHFVSIRIRFRLTTF
jgi:HD superfamily phosphodiesterase